MSLIDEAFNCEGFGLLTSVARVVTRILSVNLGRNADFLEVSALTFTGILLFCYIYWIVLSQGFCTYEVTKDFQGWLSITSLVTKILADLRHLACK